MPRDPEIPRLSPQPGLVSGSRVCTSEHRVFQHLGPQLFHVDDDFRLRVLRSSLLQDKTPFLRCPTANAPWHPLQQASGSLLWYTFIQKLWVLWQDPLPGLAHAPCRPIVGVPPDSRVLPPRTQPSTQCKHSNTRHLSTCTQAGAHFPLFSPCWYRWQLSLWQRHGSGCHSLKGQGPPSQCPQAHREPCANSPEGLCICRLGYWARAGTSTQGC